MTKHCVYILTVNVENNKVFYCFDNRCPNAALVPIINKQTSREPHIMALLRPLVLACLRFNINFTASHIPGRCNILADKLSRLQVDEFRVLAPWVTASPREVPYHVSPAGLGIQSHHLCTVQNLNTRGNHS